MKKFIAASILLMGINLVTSTAIAKEDSECENSLHDRPSFTYIDLNQDGTVNLDEFTQHDIPFGDHQSVFNRIDTNADGIIDKEEFTSHKPPHRRKGRNNIRI